MDGWQSDLTVDSPGPNVDNNAVDWITASNIPDDVAVDSPDASKDDSIDSSIEEHADKTDTGITKPTFKSILQAKKRLQAFSAVKQPKKGSSKEERSEEEAKFRKSSKKSKKVLHPMDKAKAVIREIEEMKQKEQATAQQEQKRIDALMSYSFQSDHLKSGASSEERQKHFKKREIKCRNYRRSDSYRRCSPSPEANSKKSGKLVYPQNWGEYKQRGLTTVKDEELKSKIFPKSKHNVYELVGKFLTFDGPSPLLEPFKNLSVEEQVENIPMPFIRITRSKPAVTFSVNNKKHKESYLTRKQLFHVISRDRRSIIEKLINSASSKPQYPESTLSSRPWYSKSWKKSADAECKVLENSVGLSFLQTYSDEEEDNEVIDEGNGNESDLKLELGMAKKVQEYDEKIIINNIVLGKSRRNTLALDDKSGEECREYKKDEKLEYSKKQVEELIEESKLRRKKEDELFEEGECMKQVEIKKQPKEKSKDMLNETRKAIKELEEELERRKTIKLEEEEDEEEELEKEVKKKKKKKVKKKGEDTSDSEEEQKSKKKKKKKIKTKKKKHKEEEEEEEEEEDSSSDNEKPKKSKKKSRRKKEKLKKRKDKSKNMESVTKESKVKKRDEADDTKVVKSVQRKKKKSESEDNSEVENVEEEKKTQKKLRKRSKGGTDEEDMETLEMDKKHRNQKGEAKNKKKKRKKRSRRESVDSIEEIDLTEDFTKVKSPAVVQVEQNDLIFVLPQKIEDGCIKIEENSREDIGKHKKDESKFFKEEAWSDRAQIDIPKVNYETNFLEKPENTKKTKKEPPASIDFDIDHFPRSKSKKEEHTEERESDKKSTKSTAKISRHEYEEKTSKNKKADEIFRFADEKKQESFGEGPKNDEFEKEKGNKKHRAETTFMKNRRSWEDLMANTSRHRHSNYNPPLIDLSDDFADFPLEKDIFFPKQKGRNNKDSGKHEIGTPDTEGYSENWEKDSLPLWESEDEVPAKTKEKINNSWESDEEIFERDNRVIERRRPLRDTFDLEIPLNIKPFKRREIVNPDFELQLLKQQSLSLSEERRRLEIEKMKVKELELEVIKEVEFKVKVDKRSKRRRSPGIEFLETRKSDPTRKTSQQRETIVSKRGRWDKKLSSPKIPTPNRDIIDFSQMKKEIICDEDSLTNVSSSTSINTSAMLENEYEEFMKALTSPKNHQEKNKLHDIEFSGQTSSPSYSKLDDTRNTTKTEEDKTPVKIPKETPSEQNIPLPPLPTPVVNILPKDIPLIPMPKTEIKPVPAPSPQIELDVVPKPLINLSLSANITLDIGPKFTAAPVLGSPSTTVNSLQAVITQSPKTREEPVNFPPNTTTETNLETENEISSDTRLNNKPFVFTSMVLPSKKALVNSNINLGDSDEDSKPGKSLRMLDEFIKESKTDDAKKPVEQEKVEIEAKERSERKVEIEEKPKETKESDRSTRKQEKDELARPRSPERETRRKRSPSRREGSPRRSHGSRREPSPRRRSRESPVRRRGHSPKRRRMSPKRRSPVLAKRRYSPIRSSSPKARRRSLSPRRKSPPRRSLSPRYRASPPKKLRPKSPDRHLPYKPLMNSNRPRSPTMVTSPLEGLKRSVADSTISDDLLPQSMVIDEYTQSPISQYYDRTGKAVDSPKRVSLDTRINQVLGLGQAKEQPQPIPTTYSSNYSYGANQFAQQQFNKMMVESHSSQVMVKQQVFGKPPVPQLKNSFVQVGNMVQILPTHDLSLMQRKQIPIQQAPPPAPRPVKMEKSRIVQVGNMLQIVPTELPPVPPLPAEPSPPPPVEAKMTVTETMPPAYGLTPVVADVAHIQEKPSAETAMQLKVAERREEREMRRQERERRRKEKERRRKEKEKQRQIKLRQKTENMIKRALELEVEGIEEEPESALNETPAQWPPLPIVVSSTSKEAGRSILRSGESPRLEKRKVLVQKIVQFADGVRPGEGTSPSGGEELNSPPPRKKLPKEKRYKKTKLQKKNQKKKVKVKIIKKRGDDVDDSDDEDGLPPPSPPPGSPPPHIFPPRVKQQPAVAINTMQPYMTGIVQLQGQQQIYRPPQQPQLNLVMHPHHGPPHHHGPPPPPPGPPHHHHGPPLPPPGPPHFHHGPPPPPPHHHHGPPPPPGPHHHHHGPPPPPYHH